MFVVLPILWTIGLVTIGYFVLFSSYSEKVPKNISQFGKLLAIVIFVVAAVVLLAGIAYAPRAHRMFTEMKMGGMHEMGMKHEMKGMNDLYRNELRWYQNFFQPSVKLRRKVRVGSKLRRYYSLPKTPFQRLCEYHKADKNKIKELKMQFASLNPFELRDSIDAKIRRLSQLAVTKKVARKGSYESRMYAEIKGDLARLRNTGLGLPF